MKQERLRTPDFTIIPTSSEDVVEMNHMHGQAWLDTYPNEEYGVSREWVEARIAQRSSPEAIEKRRKFIEMNMNNPGQISRIAKNAEGHVIGMTHGYVDDQGRQHLGSLYVAKEYYGSGVANELMSRVINWSDPRESLYLEFVAYNERAKAFYRKWGFHETVTELEPYAGKMPQIEMARRGDAQ